jgi:hypothetical protein
VFADRCCGHGIFEVSEVINAHLGHYMGNY